MRFLQKEDEVVRWTVLVEVKVPLQAVRQEVLSLKSSKISRLSRGARRIVLVKYEYSPEVKDIANGGGAAGTGGTG